MVPSPNELPEDRPGTFAEDGSRVSPHPADYRGKWKSRRQMVHLVLLSIFLLLPWVRVNGVQAVFLDLAHRRFTFFGVTLWSHDAPLLFLVFATIAMLTAFVTSIWGRIWCGWACPQTVFVDSVYRRIERWIEGPRLKRIQIDQAPWRWPKLKLRVLKWSAFAAVTFLFSHSFVAYFVGTENLLPMMIRSPFENWNTFAVMLFFFAVPLFDFGWFREQFCVIMCPYGRLQALLTDVQTMTVAYDHLRGEPRRGSPKLNIGSASEGDCVNCFRCVQVCPTGIDIRRGMHQLECISCTACMDACDEVMEKTKRPLGLIRYANENQIPVGSNSAPPPTRVASTSPQWKLLRPRPLVYLAIALIASSSLGFLLHRRAPVKSIVLRAINTPYQVIPAADGRERIINHFHAEISNHTHSEVQVQLQISDQERNLGTEIVTALPQIRVAAGSTQRWDFFVRFDRVRLASADPLQLSIRSLWTEGESHENVSTSPLKLTGPNTTSKVVIQ